MIESGELLPTGGAYDIEGGRPLRGEIRLSGAKNAATKLIVAALLADGVSVIANVPRIRDVTLALGI